MGRLKSSGLVAVLALACAVVPAVAVAAQSSLGTRSPAAAAANSVTFNDSTGEDPAAPDITTINVANNDAGMITFRISLPNRPTLELDMEIDIFANTDNNTATGDPDLAGADYVIAVQRGEPALFKWDGTTYSRRFGDPSAVTLAMSYQGGAATLRISAAEFGNTKQLRFLVLAVSGLVFDPITGALDDANAKADVAPGGGAGLYPYAVKVGHATLVVRKFSTTPSKPAAGKPFALRLQVARSDTGAVVQGGSVSCLGRIGSARVRGNGRFVGRQGVCTFAMSASAKGKRFRGSITIVFEGLRSTRSFSGTIG